MPDTPKVIHFIWAGGNRPLPENAHEVIMQWAKQNPHFKVMLWVDEKNLIPESVYKIYAERGYGQRSDAAAFISKGHVKKPQIQIASISNLFNDAKHILGNAITQQARRAIRYEIDKFHPNYGASSDILRYLILSTYGGAYFDSDVLPGDRYPLAWNPAFTGRNHVFQVTGSTQGAQDIGNDAFISSKQNPLMIQLLKDVLQNYYNRAVLHKLGLNDPDHMANYRYFYRSAVVRTGPAAVKAFLAKQGLTIESAEGAQFKEQYQNLLLHPRHTYVPPNTFSNEWINFFTNASGSLAGAVNNAVSKMLFELQAFGVLRCSDYIEDICLSLKADLTSALVKGVPLESFSELFYTQDPSLYEKFEKENARLSGWACCQRWLFNCLSSKLPKEEIIQVLQTMDKRMPLQITNGGSFQDILGYLSTHPNYILGPLAEQGSILKVFNIELNEATWQACQALFQQAKALGLPVDWQEGKAGSNIFNLMQLISPSSQITANALENLLCEGLQNANLPLWFFKDLKLQKSDLQLSSIHAWLQTQFEQLAKSQEALDFPLSNEWCFAMPLDFSESMEEAPKPNKALSVEAWLTDEHIRFLLAGKNLHHTLVMPAVNAQHHATLISQNIFNNYVANQGYPEPFTIVPINFNNRHWACMVIEQNPMNHQAPNVYFFDSMGQSEKNHAIITRIIQNTGIYNQANIIDLSPSTENDYQRFRQTDGYTCGTWMIEAATAIIDRRQHHQATNPLNFALEQNTITEQHRQNIGRLNTALLASSENINKDKSSDSKSNFTL